MAKKYDIFISYRRKGGVKDARLVDEKLRNSGYSVSFDIDTFGRGKFTNTIKSRLENCKDFLVIFEPSYYEKFYDENGQVLPEDILEQDWCYLELKNALQMNKNIVPLTPEDFIFPNNLPKSIKDVAEMNSIQLTEKEFKEIFEYKVKSYLISKPKITYLHKNLIIAALSLMVITAFCVVAYLVYFSLEANKKAEAARLAADSMIKAQREAFVLDSVKKVMEARAAFVADSIKAKDAEKQPAAIVPYAATSANTSQKIELYWVNNGDETGKILFEKLSKAGLKSGKCSGNGIKIAVSKPTCVTNAVGIIKCAYDPQLTATTCSGQQIDKFSIGQTFNGSNKDEALSRARMLEELQKANFNTWVSKLQSLRR